MWYEMQLDWLLLFLPLICSTPGSRGCWQALVFCTATGSPSEGWSKPALAGLYWVSWVGGEVGGQPEEKGEQKVPECFLLGRLWIVLFNTFADYSVWYYIVFFFFFWNKIKSVLSQSGEAGHSKTLESGFLALPLTGGMTFEKLICHLNLSFLFWKMKDLKSMLSTN